jgi:hypothetical protein
VTADERFRHELEVFRTEEESGTQFFYAYLGVHAIAYDNANVHRLLNTAPLFWNTCLGALQTAAFIALGRVFDQSSTHNLDKVLRIAQDNPKIFSKAALARRKHDGTGEPPDWLDDYLRKVYEPIPQDFRRLRAHVKRRRQIYEANYRDVRHKFFAHKAVSDPAEAALLFSKGTNRELQQLFTFLGSLHEALWQLFYNGLKPVLRPVRYSVKRIRNLPSPGFRRGSAQEQILREAETFLLAASPKQTSEWDG